MRRMLLALLVATAGCQRGRPASAPPPPSAEFLLNAGDSTFWVVSGRDGVRVRGSPILLARYDGRFYEIFVADDDFSYQDALMVGQRLYRRDIRTGDSSAVFIDTLVPRIAVAYARAHPHERPLNPDDETNAEPATSATAELDVLELLGPYLSYEYHADVEHRGEPAWHTTRRGVVDLRSGRQVRVTDIFGQATGRRLAALGRQAYESARDSMLRVRDRTPGDRAAGAVLTHLRFDETSFALEPGDDGPAVRFAIPGRGEGPAGTVLELEPIPANAADWWNDVRGGLAQESDSVDRWPGRGYAVLARYDTSGEVARLSLTDGRREWPVRTVTGPLRRIEWLDAPSLDSVERHALSRAFDEAASYDERSRIASLSLPTIHASFQARTRQPARNLRADDARRREQSWARVRRRHPVDDGQMRGDRGLSALARERGDGVDRPRRLSRADPSW